MCWWWVYYFFFFFFFFFFLLSSILINLTQLDNRAFMLRRLNNMLNSSNSFCTKTPIFTLLIMRGERMFAQYWLSFHHSLFVQMDSIAWCLRFWICCDLRTAHCLRCLGWVREWWWWLCFNESCVWSECRCRPAVARVERRHDETRCRWVDCFTNRQRSYQTTPIGTFEEISTYFGFCRAVDSTVSFRNLNDKRNESTRWIEFATLSAFDWCAMLILILSTSVSHWHHSIFRRTFCFGQSIGCRSSLVCRITRRFTWFSLFGIQFAKSMVNSHALRLFCLLTLLFAERKQAQQRFGLRQRRGVKK